jgi:hypothetical protein
MPPPPLSSSSSGYFANHGQLDVSLESIPSLTTIATALDVEKASSPASRSPIEKHSELKSSKLIDWDGPDDPTNPRNWAPAKKWTVTVIVSLFAFIRYFSDIQLSRTPKTHSLQPSGLFYLCPSPTPDLIAVRASIRLYHREHVRLHLRPRLRSRPPRMGTP